MKLVKALCITRQSKIYRRFVNAINDQHFTVTQIENLSKCLDLITHEEIGFIILSDEYKSADILIFFAKLNTNLSQKGIHIIVYGKHENILRQANEIYKAGVIDFLPANANFSQIAIKYQVYSRLYRKKKRIREVMENIMPPAVIDELEVRGKFPPRRHGLVTVMFTDFVKFTQKTEYLEPVELVNLLDWYYKKFDKIIADHKLEKIKTIGDAYMCAGGVPKRIGYNPVRVTLAAIAIREFMEKTARQNKFNNKPIWDIRIGINSGHLVSGIVGSLKYAYDIWGETVNVAARMENNGEPGEINISHQTYEMIKDYFVCETRGEVEAKYIGKVKMYFVRNIKPEFSINGNGHTPTEELKQLAGIIKLNYDGAKDHMLARLRNELPEYLVYHGWHHTLGVLKAVETLGKFEEIIQEEQLLLNTAAIYHDCGYLESYWNNEEIAVKIVRKTLPKFGYTTSQINTICAIIRSTKARAIPKSKLEKIMNDADYDYLGQANYHEIANKLMLEWQHLGSSMPAKQWIKTQISFLEKHKYYTDSAIDLREIQKQKNLSDLYRKLEKTK